MPEEQTNRCWSKEREMMLPFRESELRYRRLFERAQDGILIIDLDSERIIDANPFLTKVLGYSRDDLLGEKLWEIGPFRDAARCIFSSLRAFSSLDDLYSLNSFPLREVHERSLKGATSDTERLPERVCLAPLPYAFEPK